MSQKEMSPFTLDPLVDVLSELRGPNGCSWDKLQTHSSLRRYLLEEVYETLEAIDEKNIDHLREELGDLLLQIVFHARVAEENGYFTMQDVVDDITAKMVRRHPHVFQTADRETVGDTLATWEELKAKEKGHERTSILDGISPGLPALLRAQKLQEKASKVGFDWPTEEGVWAKFYEEIDEFKREIFKKDIEKAEEEGGDVLFSLINLFKWYKIVGENALHRTNTKFIQRFSYVEQEVQRSGKKWEDFTLKELDTFWEAAKAKLNSHD